MKQRIVMIICLAFIKSVFLDLNIASASEQFDTKYNVQYDITENGETQVTQNISIINKQGDVVASSYSLNINKMNIYNVAGKDSKGFLDIKVENGETTKISTTFNEQIIGLGRSLDWILQYKTKDIATRIGETWNITIPKIETLDTTVEYNVSILIPKAFGPEIFVSPRPTGTGEDNKHYILTFNKETLKDKGISASYGKNQIFNFKLNYILQNNSVFTSFQEIALPPDIIGRQKLKYKNIEPIPFSLTEDKDGNFIAKYKVDAKQTIEVKTTGTAMLSGKQILPDFGGKMSDIPAKLINEYTKEEKYWEVSSEPIQKIAKDLLDKNLTTAQNAQKAYEYVSKTLKYDFEVAKKDFINRSGALNALTQSNSWACMEFTDSFIAITRAMGIPAREINGFAYTRESNLTPLSISLKSGDLLHSWAEFYDPIYGWVPVDPTWGSTSGVDYFTKLDTSHFAFVIKGVDSEYPYPAGSYKIIGNEKQVEVDIAQNIALSNFETSLQVFSIRSKNPLDFITKKDNYLVYNEGGTKVYNINGTGKNLLPKDLIEISLPQNSREIYYENENRDPSYYKFEVSLNPPMKKQTDLLITLLSVGGAILLCTTIYVLIAHSKDLQILHYRLHRRLRGRGRSPNQR